MAEATTNLTDVAADRVQIWNGAKGQHENIRDIFLNVSNVISPTRFEQQVGDELDVILTYPEVAEASVPSLEGIVAYIEQEKLGTGATLITFYNITRQNRALIQDLEVIPRRGRTGKGIRGARGAPGKAFVILQE